MARHFPFDRQCPKPPSWPKPDQEAWARAHSTPDPFNPGSGRALSWRNTTREQYLNAYGRWLRWLEVSGLLDENVSPATRATKANVQAFYQRLCEDGLRDFTLSGRLRGVAQILSVLHPDEDFGWISKVSNRVHARAKPSAEIEHRLRPADEVIEVGYDLMRQAEAAEGLDNVARAALFRDGLMIALLVLRPFRVANFAAIHVESQLHRRGDEWWLAFSAEETKGKRPDARPWPRELLGKLEIYLTRYRPALAACSLPQTESSGLWLSIRGRPLTKGDVYYRIQLHTRNAIGVAVRPHDFRRMAATTVASADPEGATGIAALLHHSRLETSEIHYNKARQVDAGLRYQTIVRRPRAPRPACLAQLELFDFPGARKTPQGEETPDKGP